MPAIPNDFDKQAFENNLYFLGLLSNHMGENACDNFDPNDKTKIQQAKDFKAMVAEHRRQFQLKLRINQAAKSKKDNPNATGEPMPAHWADDIDAFAREALHVDLFDHQRQLCRSPKRTVILIAGRGAGKSVAARVKAVHRAIRQPGHTVLVVSSGQRMSSDFGEKLHNLIIQSPIQRHVERVSQNQILFKNRSAINFLPAQADTIRGYHPATTNNDAGLTVILDEACFMEHGDDIRKAVEYALITTGRDHGSLTIVTSPSSIRSWVYNYVKLADNEDSDIEIIQCGSAANPTIPAEELERLRATKNELEYRAEVLGEWTDSAYSLFNGLIEPNIAPIDPAAIPETAIFALGADLAVSYSPTHDRNAIAVVAKTYAENEIEEEEEPNYALIKMIVLDQASDKEVRTTISRLASEFSIRTAYIENYQGKSVAEYCESLKLETTLVSPSAGAQQTVFHEMHRLLRQGKLTLAADLPGLFFSEIKAFEYRREANGHVSFGHPASKDQHDDTVYAAAWALQAAQTAKPKPTKPSIAPIIKFIPKK
ncbi:hypothetical protein GF373_12920 [bacterium]|nr:hypothetical protein [bacterium]